MGGRTDLTLAELAAFSEADWEKRYPIPSKAEFYDDDGEVERDFISAPDLDAMLSYLETTRPGGQTLDIFTFGQPPLVRWKAKGGTSAGNNVMGKTTKPGGLLKFELEEHYGYGVPAIIWLAADHMRDVGYTYRQVLATLHHEALHVLNDEGAVRIVGHDAEVFFRNLQQFGAYAGHLRQLANVAGQMAQPALNPDNPF